MIVNENVDAVPGRSPEFRSAGVPLWAEEMNIRRFQKTAGKITGEQSTWNLRLHDMPDEFCCNLRRKSNGPQPLVAARQESAVKCTLLHLEQPLGVAVSDQFPVGVADG